MNVQSNSGDTTQDFGADHMKLRPDSLLVLVSIYQGESYRTTQTQHTPRDESEDFD